MFLIIVLYLHNECAAFWQWQLLKPWQQKCSYCLPFSSPCHSLQAWEARADLQGALLCPLSFNRLFFFYLSLPLLRNKNIFMQVNVSRTSMQMLPLGLSYLLIIFYRLMRQKLPIQLNMPQINLEMHLLSSKTGRKLNTVNILSDRKVSGSFYKTPILTFLSLLSVNPIWDATPQWPLAV